MNRVVVVGSANLDLGVGVRQLPRPGETVLGSDVVASPGGKGANQAVAARRLGADAVLVAALGGDRFGADLRVALAGEGLPPDHVVTYDDCATGIALIVVDADGENTIVVSSGANARLDAAALAGLPDLLGSADLLVLQLEIPLDTCLAAARHARRAGARVLLNAAPLPPAGAPALAELLREVDVLVVNEGEAAELGGDATALRHRGPAACVITLGARGAVSADATGTRTHRPFRVDAVDTTGAGDTFCGALAAALAEGAELDEAVRRGCAAGALATTRMGAQSAMPMAAELDSFLVADYQRE
ncbi:ribokinase [Asanoa iriomotensis]|uniref:Ribokinase n=1 Tax=Asanoa iriomotensis TaxID=234613 RepID=A0ABQ4BYI3_9ACTN|nr:ribokinase [Asanoa iriomotensis]GIF55592.1 ribokinase [Asanoa iriomotensis]